MTLFQKISVHSCDEISSISYYLFICRIEIIKKSWESGFEELYRRFEYEITLFIVFFWVPKGLKFISFTRTNIKTFLGFLGLLMYVLRNSNLMVLQNLLFLFVSTQKKIRF